MDDAPQYHRSKCTLLPLLAHPPYCPCWCIHPDTSACWYIHPYPCLLVHTSYPLPPCRYGVTNTLDRVFTAHKLVKAVLRDESFTHDTLVGNSDTPRLVQELFKDYSDVSMVFTPDGSFK